METDARNWLIPLFYSTLALVLVGSAFTLMEHRYANEDRSFAAKKFAKITRLEDATRDMLKISNRSIILYYAGEQKPWDGYVVYWPDSAVELLGWTWEDIQKNGLGCLMLPEDRTPHVKALEKFVDVPLHDRKTSVVKKNAIHKDGHEVPVVMSVWVVGDQTRTVAATIDAQSNYREK